MVCKLTVSCINFLSFAKRYLIEVRKMLVSGFRRLRNGALIAITIGGKSFIILLTGNYIVVGCAISRSLYSSEKNMSGHFT